MVTGYASKELRLDPTEATLTSIDQEMDIIAIKQNLISGTDYNQIRGYSGNSTIVEVVSYSANGLKISAKANGTTDVFYVLQLSGVEKYKAKCRVTVNIEE